MLVIFLIVLGVIGTFVVPPIMKVLRERDAMVQKTADDKKSAEQFGRRGADYERRWQARVAGVERARRGPSRGPQGHRRRAGPGERRGGVDAAAGRRAIEGAGARGDGELQSSVETLSATLASRILGVEVTTRTAATRAGR